MSGDWSGWWLRSDYGRDRMLRDQVDRASADAAAAHSRNARLRSELSQIRGSLEQRIQALSRAFDAYVELGDVREQLTAFPDTSQARVQAMRALEVLRAGGVPEPLAHGDGDYWLTHAINALIARVHGPGDAEAEARAAELGGAEFDTFWVCALGALGHGDRAAGQLDRTLANDGTFSPLQLKIFRLLVLGGYGPAPSLAALQPALEQESAETWRDWLAKRDRDPVLALEQVWDDTAPQEETRPGPTTRWSAVAEAEETEVEPVDQARAALGAVVAELIGRGQGEEGLLLARIRELRRMVESPLQPTAGAATEAPVPVGDAARRALRDPDGTVELHRELLRLARRPLLEIVDAATVAPELDGVIVTARTHSRSVSVRATGPDAAQLDSAYQSLAAIVGRSYAVPVGIGAAAALLVGVVLLILGSTVFAIVLILLGLGLGGYAWTRALTRRRTLQFVEQSRTALDAEIRAAQQRAAAADEAAREQARRVAATAVRLRSDLQTATEPTDRVAPPALG